MTGDELLRRIKRIAKERDLRYELDQAHGKGSHGTVYLGERRATLPYSKREVKPGTLSGILRQLGLANVALKAVLYQTLRDRRTFRRSSWQSKWV